MISSEMLSLGKNNTKIRELFEYGLRQAELVGRENVYDFSLGNPSVPAPQNVAAVIEGLNRQSSLLVHGYTPARGNRIAQEAIAADLSVRTDSSVHPENIIITCGAAPAIISTIKALAVEDSEFLVIAPYFPEYPMYMQACHTKMVTVPADTEEFQIDLAALEARVTPYTQAVLVNSPNNPSGAVYSRRTLHALADILRQKSLEYGHTIYIIADEPYRELVYDGADTAYLPDIYPHTVICYSYSKSLSLPGERIGYAFVPSVCERSEDLLTAIAGAARTLGHVCAPSMMQLVIARNTRLRPDVKTYDRNRRLLYEGLTKIGFSCVKPQGAFYMLVAAPGGDAAAFSEMAQKRNLLIVPTDSFGCPGFCRLSTCVDADMIERSLPVFEQLWQDLRGLQHEAPLSDAV